MMSLLEEALQEQEALTRKGYSIEQIQCAAMQVIAERLTIATTPLIQVQEHNMPERNDGDD